MTDYIHNMTHTHMQELAASMDAFLLAFFGSEENIREFAHLYVLEAKESEIIHEPSDDLSIAMHMTTEYRLRLKTEEERTADLGPEDM
jgi:hypothetical protein